MDKTAIKNFSIWARNKLIADISYKAGLLGITEKEIKDPLPQSTQAVQFFDIGSREPYSISGSAIEQRKRLVEEINSKAKQSKYATAYESVIEEVAYTWFNRLIAIRFMEVNDYLPTKIRVLSSEIVGKLEPDLVTYALEADLGYSAYEKDRITQLKHENKLDELFRMLFIKQCNALNTILPELFEKTNDYTELLFNVSFTDKDGVIYHLVNDIAEDDFNVSKEGQVEILGWLYQYYNTEPKQAVFDGLKKNIKITKEKIPAATQLFTPNWIVRYMVENSLGRLWLESHPNDELKSNWRYYLDEAEQKPEVEEQLNAIRSQSPVKSPEDIRLIDPCMGSGHILVYAFDVLMQIYESEGYNPRDAVIAILENNIYGLDIDRRAHQLAYFSLMMKARQYNRRIFSEDIKPQVYHPAGFPAGEEFGSLVKVDTLPPMPVKKTGQLSFEDISYDTKLNAWNFQRLLAHKYDVVITNPPYMGASGANSKLSNYLKNEYPNTKSDMFAAFMERGLLLSKHNGFTAMITQQAWMFLSSYERLRNIIFSNNTIINMAHLGNGAFGFADFGLTSFVIYHQTVNNYCGTYYRLVEDNSPEWKKYAFLSGKYSHFANTDSFANIPGSPVAYWVSESVYSEFGQDSILQHTISDGQNKTGNNEKYLRLFWEVFNGSIGYKKNYRFYAKGGNYRKWYGNLEYVIDWSERARLFYRKDKIARLIPEYLWYKSGITWTLLSSSNTGFRELPEYATFDVTGSSLFLKDEKELPLLLAVLNSKVGEYLLSILSSTMAYQITEIRRIPLSRQILPHSSQIIDLANQCLLISRFDWDAFETSWDFKAHPLIELKEGAGYGADMSKWSYTIKSGFANWKVTCNDRFTQLKANEEELNRIFIDIYGLLDELNPEVADKDVTVARIYDKKEDIPVSMKGNSYVLTKSDVIKSFISYAIGCMFGRYSLDIEGLAYAGGDWDDSKYQTFIPDEDNIILITDEEYFDNDIVGLFVDFIKVAYGQDTLEENLDFIADALGNRGDSSREIIRNYILKDFFKDHCRVYKKRPIYWLFDSGKQNGFKALVYMHRYDENTIGNLRIDHLHKMQQVYENEISRMQDTIDNSINSREVNAANKRKEKLIKQLQETKEYDEKIAHLALIRVPIDLDDGVKVNYEKAQTDRDGNKYDVLAKIR